MFLHQPLGCSLNTNVNITMSRTLYSPKLSDDVVRALYREGQRLGIPMTRLADLLLRQSLAPPPNPAAGLLRVAEDPPELSGARDAV